MPDLSIMIRSRINELYLEHLTEKGMSILSHKTSSYILTESFLGNKSLPIYTMVVNVVVLANAVSFFGNEIGKEMMI